MLAFLPIVQGHQGQLRHQLPIVLIARRLVALGGFAWAISARMASISAAMAGRG